MATLTGARSCVLDNQSLQSCDIRDTQYFKFFGRSVTVTIDVTVRLDPKMAPTIAFFLALNWSDLIE